MNNVENEIDFYNIKGDGSQTKNKKFLSKKHFKSKDFQLEDFEDGLNLSGIENNEENIAKNQNNFDNSINDFSDDLESFNERDSDSSLRDISIEGIEKELDSKNDNNNNKNNYKKKKTKEDLDNIPLPIFDCIYCTNEKIVFNNFINKSLSDKYLFLTSVYDINDLNNAISNSPLIGKNGKNDKLINIIIKNTEYIKEYIPKEKNTIFFKSNLFYNLCEQYNSKETKMNCQNKDYLTNQKDFSFKDVNTISRNCNNRCLNSTNSLVNNCNSLGFIIESIPKKYENNFKTNNTNISCTNNSLFINSLSLFNNENFYFNNNKDNNNKFENIEKIEKKEDSSNYVEDKDELLDIFKFDLKRKKSKNDIEWDNKYYDIYNPEISSDYEYSETDGDEIHVKNTFKRNVNIKYRKNFSLNNSMQYKKYNNGKNTIDLNYVNNKYRQNKFINNDINTKRVEGLYRNNNVGFNSFINNKNINKNNIYINNINFSNQLKNKKNILKYNSSCQNENTTTNNSTNYSIDVSMNSKNNYSKKQKNFLNKGNNSNDIFYLHDKHIINHKYKLSNVDTKKKIIKKKFICYNNFNNLKNNTNTNWIYSKKRLNNNFNTNYPYTRTIGKDNNKTNKKVITNSSFQYFNLKEKNEAINNDSFNNNKYKENYSNNLSNSKSFLYKSNNSFSINKNPNNKSIKKVFIPNRNTYKNNFNSNKDFYINKTNFNCQNNYIRNTFHKKYYFRKKKKKYDNKIEK